MPQGDKWMVATLPGRKPTTEMVSLNGKVVAAFVSRDDAVRYVDWRMASERAAVIAQAARNVVRDAADDA